MDTLKKIFPLSFGASDVAGLVIKIIIYIVVAAIGGIIIGLAAAVLALIPFIGGVLAWLVGSIGSLVGLYSLIGIVLTCLDYFKILK